MIVSFRHAIESVRNWDEYIELMSKLRDRRIEGYFIKYM